MHQFVTRLEQNPTWEDLQLRKSKKISGTTAGDVGAGREANLYAAVADTKMIQVAAGTYNNIIELEAKQSVML